MARGTQKRRKLGRRLFEYSLVAIVIAVLAAIAMPQLLGAREKARTSTTDNIYVALNGEAANELDSSINGAAPAFEPRAETLARARSLADMSVTLSSPAAPADDFGREGYDPIEEVGFVRASTKPLSTFSVDVDTASYTNVRRILRSGRLPPADAVRIEEFINYFDYDDALPGPGEAFSVNVELGAAPWAPEHRLARIALRGREVLADEVGPIRLVFLIDVSGSMAADDKLPLVRRSLHMLSESLGADDRIAIVAYAGKSGLRLKSTSGDARRRIRRAINGLEAGGSTNGASGIQLAYRAAREHFVEGGVNRVMLATDGDFNVGITDRDELVDLIREQARSGVFLTVLGFGTGNLRDSQLEQLADRGNGHYAYVDGIDEARRVLVEKRAGTLVTIAKDVKLQVEMNPARVAAYRLLGYENRRLEARDFNDDRKDAGEIGAGHRVTALYEIVPVGTSLPRTVVDQLRYREAPAVSREALRAAELMNVKIRYKEPGGTVSRLLTQPVLDARAIDVQESADFALASAAAAFGMVLRNSENRGAADLELVARLAKAGVGEDPTGRRHELVSLVTSAERIQRTIAARTVPEREATAFSYATPSVHVAAQLVEHHAGERNPLNRNQPAYVLAPPHELAPGQVGIRPGGGDTIVFYQYPRPGAALRSFSVSID